MSVRCVCMCSCIYSLFLTFILFLQSTLDIMPFYDGVIERHVMKHAPRAGGHVTDFLMYLLNRFPAHSSIVRSCHCFFCCLSWKTSSDFPRFFSLRNLFFQSHLKSVVLSTTSKPICALSPIITASTPVPLQITWNPLNHLRTCCQTGKSCNWPITRMSAAVH